MNNNFDVVIGVEIHIELKTKTKCFSSAPNTFAANPNSQVNPIDAGYPGTLPILNQEVVVSAIKLAHVLNMKIDPLIRFDRKNYFYPDLPKGYQITQFYHPIGKDGHLKVNCDQQEFTVNFERVHIEEDTAKQIHEANVTLLDYNRAGIPLLEIVTQPVFSTAQQVVAYITALRRILIYLDISDAKMNEGSLRCDINISLKPVGSSILGTKIEIKNLNSLNNITLAIADEINRQKQILVKKQKVLPQTRRFDEKTSKTILMREKLDMVDYKYFPEPNIFPIKLEQKWINNIVENLPLLPDIVAQKLVKNYQLNDNEVNYLIDKPEIREFFERCVQENKLIKPTINYLIGPVQAYFNANNFHNINDTKLTAKNLAQLVTLIEQQKINDKQSKIILEKICTSDEFSPEKLLEILKIKVIDNKTEIKMLLYKIFQDNPMMLAQYYDNPGKANKFFMGQLMKLTKGQVNPQLAQTLINKLIKEFS